MGILSWFNGSKLKNSTARNSCGSSGESGMNGAEEVKRVDPPLDLTVLAFGNADKEMLAGYCPVSEKIEPCTWKVETIKPEPGRGNDHPKIRILF